MGCGETLAGWFGFDGENVIRAQGGYTNPNWRWANGPGLDDALVGLWQYGTNNYAKQYYLTDGRGRHLAFTDSLGNNEMDAPVYYQNGGNQAGTIEASTNFGNSRAGAGTPGVSFYRNRYYDQATGRFLTEDPIGMAGGINLYAYAGNNPARLTDPFGLEPCPEPPCPEPSEGPPVALPPGKDGQPNSWIKKPGTGERPNKWVPKLPLPSQTGGQPGASWDPNGGHWDVDDGQGNRRRYLPDGTEVDHDNNPIPTDETGKRRWNLPSVGDIVGMWLGGVAAILEAIGQPHPAMAPPLPGFQPLPSP